MNKFMLVFFLFLSFSCTPNHKKNIYKEDIISSDKEDKKIVEQILKSLENQPGKSIANLVAEAGKMLEGTPYVAHTLEADTEKLIINLRELDCTTFAENCLALARAAKSSAPSFETFVKELKKIRYFGDEISDYTSRIHYFSDWIYENDKKGIIKDVSEEIANTQLKGFVNFMSTHPQLYQQLKSDSRLIPVIAEREKQINKRNYFYIPQNKIYDVENQLKSGDIVGITTSIKGLNISHVGILVRIRNEIRLMHASSDAKKVLISPETLEDYLQNSKTATGIMVARPQEHPQY